MRESFGNRAGSVGAMFAVGMVAITHTYWVPGNARFDDKQENARTITYSEPQTRFKYAAALIR
jgi:hypothetical protein